MGGWAIVRKKVLSKYHRLGRGATSGCKYSRRPDGVVGGFRSSLRSPQIRVCMVTSFRTEWDDTNVIDCRITVCVLRFSQVQSGPYREIVPHTPSAPGREAVGNNKHGKMTTAVVKLTNE